MVCFCGGREPGCAPGGAVTFFCFAKRKSPKKRRPCCLRPLRCATGQPVMLGQGVRRRTHCALRAPFKQLRQVSARSACVLRHTHAPPALRFSARTEGNPANIHSGHRVARPSLRSAWHLRQRGGAERSNGPCGCSAVHPPAGCACGGVVAGWHGRRSAHASCSDSPWLSERRCAAAKRVPRRTPQPPRRRLPLRTAKGSQTGGRLFFGDFLLAKQKKVTRMQGDSRPPP